MSERKTMLQQHQRLVYAKNNKVALLVTEMYGHLLFEKPEDPLASLITHLEGLQKEVAISTRLEAERQQRDVEYSRYIFKKRRLLTMAGDQLKGALLLQNHVRRLAGMSEVAERHRLREEDFQRKDAASSRIQAFRRNFVAQRDVEKKREEHIAILTIQEFNRKRDAQLFIAQRREEAQAARELQRKERKRASACLIQRCQRGETGRKTIQSGLDNVTAEHLEQEEVARIARTQDATLVIQHAQKHRSASADVDRHKKQRSRGNACLTIQQTEKAKWAKEEVEVLKQHKEAQHTSTSKTGGVHGDMQEEGGRNGDNLNRNHRELATPVIQRVSRSRSGRTTVESRQRKHQEEALTAKNLQTNDAATVKEEDQYQPVVPPQEVDEDARKNPTQSTPPNSTALPTPTSRAASAGSRVSDTDPAPVSLSQDQVDKLNNFCTELQDVKAAHGIHSMTYYIQFYMLVRETNRETLVNTKIESMTTMLISRAQAVGSRVTPEYCKMLEDARTKAPGQMIKKLQRMEGLPEPVSDAFTSHFVVLSVSVDDILQSTSTRAGGGGSKPSSASSRKSDTESATPSLSKSFATIPGPANLTPEQEDRLVALCDELEEVKAVHGSHSVSYYTNFYVLVRETNRVTMVNPKIESVVTTLIARGAQVPPASAGSTAQESPEYRKVLEDARAKAPGQMIRKIHGVEGLPEPVNDALTAHIGILEVSVEDTLLLMQCTFKEK